VRTPGLARRIVRRVRSVSALEPLDVVLPTGLAEVLRDGPAPLHGRAPGAGELAIAVVVPSFRRGSGGHATIANLVRGLTSRGHHCSVWILDDEGRHAADGGEATAALFRDFFGPVQGDVRLGLDGWYGADVAVSTGWQTVPAVLRLVDTGSRAYLVQDHEPEFYATSAERLWAEWTYRQGLHCIAASPWLAELLRARYGAATSHFELGVDHNRYTPAETLARSDRVLFYARAATARRAVPLGLLALEELHRRRPDVEIALFGEPRPVRAPFSYRHLGVLDPHELARIYRESAVGLVLSLTNPSLIPQEMLACGLPCVDAAVDSTRHSFGLDGPIALAEPSPLALCAAIERLLDDPAERAQRAAAGRSWVAPRTWAAAAEKVEQGLRVAIDAAHR
jgi:glycosyltransferase involved in cell wall biosynthesis